MTVGRADQADVHLHGLAAADPVDLALLHGAQQLRLETRVHLADLVEQQGAAVGFFELADPACDGACKRAFLMAEKLGFEQVFGNRSAVDRDERLVGAAALSMNVASHQLLRSEEHTSELQSLMR